MEDNLDARKKEYCWRLLKTLQKESSRQFFILVHGGLGHILEIRVQFKKGIYIPHPLNPPLLQRRGGREKKERLRLS